MTFMQLVSKLERKLFLLWLMKDISKNQELFGALAFSDRKETPP